VHPRASRSKRHEVQDSPAEIEDDPRVVRLHVEKSSERPGGPVLVWTVEITEPSGEVTSVIADTQGAIQRVLLPPSRRPPVDWLNPATIAGAVASVGPTFGAATRIASIVFDDRGGRA
jgi:hypothetical protein